jgi:hypothetical protein
MLPHWIEKLIEGMGVPGGIIFVLLLTVSGLVAYVKSLQTKADKVYGYRLEERDTLNKALTDTAKVLEDVLEQVEERNELTSEQAELIQKQSAAFELLKVTVVAQYDNIKDHNSASAQAITAMAEAIRTLSSLVIENRAIAKEHVTSVNGSLNNLQTALVSEVRALADLQIKEMRIALGNLTRAARKRKKRVTS